MARILPVAEAWFPVAATRSSSLPSWPFRSPPQLKQPSIVQSPAEDWRWLAFDELNDHGTAGRGPGPGRTGSDRKADANGGDEEERRRRRRGKNAACRQERDGEGSGREPPFPREDEEDSSVGVGGGSGFPRRPSDIWRMGAGAGAIASRGEVSGAGAVTGTD